MALHKHNSGAENGRELFKGSKNSASLLVCNEKKFWLGVEDLLSDVTSGGLLGHLSPLCLAPGPNH